MNYKKHLGLALAVTAGLIFIFKLPLSHTPKTYPMPKDEKLAKVINAASQKVTNESSQSRLSLSDCVNFYKEIYPENNPFISKETFIKEGKETCPKQMRLLHSALKGSLDITFDDLTSKSFWEAYDKSEELLIKKVLKR